jgi:hypothetical protein
VVLGKTKHVSEKVKYALANWKATNCCIFSIVEDNGVREIRGQRALRMNMLEKA